MTQKAWKANDAFSLSLGALTSINGYTLVPAIDGKRLNRELGSRRAENGAGNPGLIAQVEDFLARYFATGCHDAG